MDEVNILATLFSNPGLLHVAEHVISFLDDKSVGQYRLVSKKSCEFLNNIWRDRMLRTAKQLCKKKFEVYEWRPVVQMDRNEMGPKIEKCIFELWPDWKNALLEIQSFEDLSVVIYLLRQYFTQWGSSHDLVSKTSPLHFAAEHNELFEGKESLICLNFFKILLETSLDFNVMFCIDAGATPLLHACQFGSKEVVELLLNNAVKKGIEVQTFTPFNGHMTAATSAVLNDNSAIVKHLFERRNEFDFGVQHEDLNIAAFQHSGTEIFEVILKWLVEKGVPLDQEFEGSNILHSCQYHSGGALFLLQNYEEFGLDRSVVISMTMSRNNENKRPIDLARENIYVDPFTEELIQELEKFT